MSERVSTTLGVSPLYAEATRRAEQVTEALCGEPLVVRAVSVREGDTWLRVEGSDRYEGWIAEADTTPIDSAWPGPNARRVGVRAVTFHRADDAGARWLPFGAWVESAPAGAVRLVDGAVGRLDPGWETPFYEAVSEPTRLERVVEALLGVPYRWGGRSVLGLDCSGFVQLVGGECGIPLPRDAWLQEEWARGSAAPVKDEERAPGDLLFWGTERATHVGIALSATRFAHARRWVRIGEWASGPDADLRPRFRGAHRPCWGPEPTREDQPSSKQSLS